MPGKGELLYCENGGAPGRDFLLAYQRSVLFALEKAGFLTREQLADCLKKLEEKPL